MNKNELPRNATRQEIALRLVEFQSETEMKWKEIARQCGMSDTQISTYKSEREYIGNEFDLNEKIRDFLNLQIRKMSNQKLVMKPVNTPQCLRVLTACRVAHEDGELIGIFGNAGIGKTMGLTSYKEKYPTQVLYVSACSGIQPIHLFKRILKEMGVNFPGMDIDKMEKIIFDLRDSGKLLIIDEAHYMKLALLEKIRSIWDETQCGIVLCGNNTVIENIRGQKSVYFEHVLSRMSLKMKIDGKVKKSDVEMILNGNGIELDKTLIDYLYRIAKKDGHFRYMTNVLNRGKKIAMTEPLRVDHLRQGSKWVFGEEIE